MTANIILAINPGSTSTKIALYDNDKPLFVKTIRHSSQELAPYKSVAQQFDFRRTLILDAIKEEGIDVQSIKAIVGRGGLLKPIASGVYEVNDIMSDDLLTARYGEHASNLGGLIAKEIAKQIDGARAFIADPVVVDEMQNIARISGHPLFKRQSIFHALNQKAVAKMYALSINKEYDDLNLIVAHMGGGISVGAHQKGRVVDVNNTLDGEGPFSPERSGTLPVGQLIEVCFSGEYSHDQVKRMVVGGGGIVAHLGTNDVKEIAERAESGEVHCALILDALCYNVGKQIGAMATVMHGNIDAILITGGIAYSRRVCNYIESMVKFISPVVVYGGEDEMEALAYNGLRVLENKEQPKLYV